MKIDVHVCIKIVTKTGCGTSTGEAEPGVDSKFQAR